MEGFWWGGSRCRNRGAGWLCHCPKTGAPGRWCVEGICPASFHFPCLVLSERWFWNRHVTNTSDSLSLAIGVYLQFLTPCLFKDSVIFLKVPWWEKMREREMGRWGRSTGRTIRRKEETDRDRSRSYLIISSRLFNKDTANLSKDTWVKLSCLVAT